MRETGSSCSKFFLSLTELQKDPFGAKACTLTSHFVCFVFEFVPKKSKNNVSTTESFLYLLFFPCPSKILLLDFAVFNPRHSCQVLVEERQTEQQSSPKSTPDEQTAASALG